MAGGAGSAGWWHRRGLAARLLASFGIVVVATAATVWLIAPTVGSRDFQRRMTHSSGHGNGMRQGGDDDLAATFAASSAWALGVALLVAVVVAAAVSLWLARRLGRPLGSLSEAVHRVAEGELGTQVPAPGMGPEFDDLAESFNRMSRRLAESERLRKRMIGDVAHELRTPVATLTGYLEALEDGVAELTPETVEMLRAQGARLTRLSEDLSAVSHAESGARELAREQRDPGELLRLAQSAVRERAAASGVRVEVSVEPELPAVAVDPERMGQVLGNLVDNALRHTPEGGAVTLAARRTDHGGVALSVTDTGVGIASEHLPHVFERFYRVDAARDRESGGSGVGLAIVAALVSAHGGMVRAESEGPGRGARFTVTLPNGDSRRS